MRLKHINKCLVSRKSSVLTCVAISFYMQRAGETRGLCKGERVQEAPFRGRRLRAWQRVGIYYGDKSSLRNQLVKHWGEMQP